MDAKEISTGVVGCNMESRESEGWGITTCGGAWRLELLKLGWKDEWCSEW